MSSNPYSAFCEDFYVNMRLGSQMNLPNQRETVLHFFERVQKEFPGMTRFRKEDSGAHSLEEERKDASYRWLSLEPKRLAAGHVNPATIADAMQLHSLALEMAPCHLGISPLEIEYLDVLFGFDLTFTGNHDEIISDTLYGESPLNCLLEAEGAKPVDFQPVITVALSDDCRLQARLELVTRTNGYQVRTGDYEDDIISVYVVMRRYWGDRPRQSMESICLELAEKADAICISQIVPRILRPLSAAIASRS